MDKDRKAPILQYLQHELGSLAWTNENRRRIHASSAKWITRKSIANAVEGILENEELLSYVCSSSYIHQLGFAKFLLTPILSNGAVLRLHIWSTSRYFPTQDDAHDHQHDFCSTILIGSLIHTIYEEGNSSEHLNVEKFSYKFDPKTQFSLQQQLGRTSLTLKNQYRIGAGTTYMFSNDIVHSVRAQAPLTITAILQAPPADKTVSVYKRTINTHQHLESRGHSDLEKPNAIQLLRQACSALKVSI